MDYHSKNTHAQNLEQVYHTLQGSAKGLSDVQAAERLKQYGYNELKAKPPKAITAMLKEQITDPMVLILVAAAGLSFLLDETIEAAVIFTIVIVNAFIGIVQEKKAQSALEALRGISAPTARVLRDGEESVIPAKEVVPGDIVFLRDGDMVPADLRLIDSVNLQIQEASLTGESVASTKDAAAILKEECPLGDRVNMAYASGIVTYGRATGIAAATGMHTEVGSIAALLDGQDEFDTPLKRKLNAAGKALTIAGLIVCVLIFALGAFYDRPLVPQFLIAVSLAISIIPEGLPATATIVMALGVQRMAKKNALVRKLPSVETLGSATVICTDKTGTLTLNKMTVTQLAMNGDFNKQTAVEADAAAMKHPEVYRELIFAAALCNDASFDPDRKGEIIGDPTEGALIYLAQKFGVNHDDLENKYPRLFEQPFDSARKRMTTVHNINGQLTAYTKGAVDEMLPLCTHILTAQGVRTITNKDKEAILALATKMSQQALRVLGFASKTLTAVPQNSSENLEHTLTFTGIAGMIDPPRKEVAAAVRTCREAGIRTIMITGDHEITAAAIAQELGICHSGNEIISGSRLNAMTDAELDLAVKKAAVFARVSPTDKLRIIQALKRNGEITAMTGDGVNDSPALKASSDMILLDDSFTTIAYAIKEGRRVYRNLQKVIQFLLAGNIAEITTLFIATLFNWNAPLLAVHILWVNLATATLPALALGVDPASKNIMKHKPVKSGTLFEKDLLTRVAVQGIFVAILTLTAYHIGSSTLSHAVGQTMAFCVLAFSQLLRALNQRSNTEYIWVRAEGHNPWLWLSFTASVALMAAILLIPVLQQAFKLTDLSCDMWFVVFALSLLSIVQIEVCKLIAKILKRAV